MNDWEVSVQKGCLMRDFFLNPNCLNRVFVKHVFKLLLPVKSIRFT